ncbi:MAG: hypothetical protein CO022_00405 [Flavobacteriales bacterium CG_4_9_14_0_2_um_filter_32_27]|nr:MAG: hypothetical protein CO022_00405 [Flavobacteriales bacterium CG_4_9_14_0_2_um_filter_32_27]
MIILKKIGYIILFFSFIQSAFAQEKLSSKEEKQIIEKAELYFEEGDFQNIPQATELFEKLEANKPTDPYFKLMVGICYTYFKDKKAISITKLKEVKEMNPEFNLVNSYLARAYAVNHQFDKAIDSYRIYLQADDLDPKDRSIAEQNIFYCENAKIFTNDSLKITINDIGSPINTIYSEYVPVITPDESMLIYTYRGNRSKGGLQGPTGKPDKYGQYYEDIMISYKLGDNWLEPESIGENINTSGHDAAVALSVDGQQLFVYKQSQKDNGDIYVSKLVGDIWSKPEKLKGLVNTEAWEGSVSLTSDGKILYFSSNRAGGFGGRDLYSASLMPDGSWGDIKNLGATINTKHDEDAPFIHPDRKTMYFSSKGHTSMGGYDIFYTYLSESGWDTPESVGHPINTIDDDRFYVLSADAKTGYYSSAGRSKNAAHNIYTVTPGHLGKRPILALVVGITEADGKPVEADITVTNDKTGELEGKFKSNSTSGKYMLALTPGNRYKIAIEVEGYDTKIDYLDIESLETYVQVEHDFKLYSKENIEGISVADTLDKLQGKIDTQIEKYKFESTDDGYREKMYNKVIKEKGDIQTDGVSFYIEPNNIENIKEIDGVAEKSTTKQGTENIILGPFKTLLEAEIFRQKLIQHDPTISEFNIKIDNNGEENTIKQYYKEDLSRVNYEQQISMHEEVTKTDSINNFKRKIELENKAKNLAENGEVILDDTTLVDAAEKTITGLTFKVEIGAVENKEDFKLSYLEKYGKITAKTYPDGLTRYTFGPFNTLEEAENFRKMLAEKEKASEEAFVTVFVFGQRKTLEEYQNDPCANDFFIDFSEFIGKDLNDTSVYNKLIRTGGNSCANGLEFKVQIAAYRFPKNYKWNHLKQYGEPKIVYYPDGITRFTQGSFNTLSEAESLRKKIIKSGQKDAWITPFYNGKRMLLEELIKVNFYGRSVN